MNAEYYDVIPETTNDYYFERGLEWWEKKEIKNKKKKKLKMIAKRNKKAFQNLIIFTAGFAIITMVFAALKVTHTI